MDDEDELMKYSRELEEDLESDTIEAVPGADSMNGTQVPSTPSHFFPFPTKSLDEKKEKKEKIQ